MERARLSLARRTGHCDDASEKQKQDGTEATFHLDHLNCKSIADIPRILASKYTRLLKVVKPITLEVTDVLLIGQVLINKGPHISALAVRTNLGPPVRITPHDHGDEKVDQPGAKEAKEHSADDEVTRQ